MNDVNGFEEIVEASTMKAVSLSKLLCLEMEFDYVKELITSSEERLSAEDLVQPNSG